MKRATLIFETPKVIIQNTVVMIVIKSVVNSRTRCCGSKIEISMMKSTQKNPCEHSLICDDHDLNGLMNIEIYFSQKNLFSRISAEIWILKSALQKCVSKLVKKLKSKKYYRVRSFDQYPFWCNDKCLKPFSTSNIKIVILWEYFKI